MRSLSSILRQIHVPIFLFTFVLANALLSSYFIDAWLTPNAASRAIPVLTLYENKSLIIDKYEQYTHDKAFMNGHYYSDKAPLSTFVVYPFYTIYKFFSSAPETVDNINKYPIYIWEPKGFKDGRVFAFPKLNAPLLLGSFLCGSVPFFIFASMIFVRIYRQESSLSPVVLVMLPIYGTFLFTLSGVYFGHLLSGFFLLLAYLYIKQERHYLFAGWFVGLAFVTEYTTAFAGIIWLFLIFYNTRSLKGSFAFCLGALPAPAFILYYNRITTGNPFDLLYNHVAMQTFSQMKENLGFRLPQAEALWGLLFSQYRGLFFYAPILILICYFFIRRIFYYKMKSIINNYLVRDSLFADQLFILYVVGRLDIRPYAFGASCDVSVIRRNPLLIKAKLLKKFILLAYCFRYPVCVVWESDPNLYDT